MRTIRLAALAGSALTLAIAAPALAQQGTPNTAASSNDTPVSASSGAVGSAAPEGDAAGFVETPPTPEEQASQSGFLAAQVEALQQQIDALKAQMTQVQPSWKGAPQFNGDNGFTFKPKGYAQFDGGYVQNPNDAISGPNLGFNTRIRRAVIGAQGTLPGGFGYNIDIDVAQSTVGYEDIILTYQGKKVPLQVTIGNFYPLTSLDSLTSSRLTSFLERAAFTDAFNYNRRLGAAVGLVDPKNDLYTLTAGIWGQEVNNTSFARTGWQTSVRGTFSPNLGGGRLHLGASYQHRRNQTDNLNVRYRARPYTQVTDQRFVDTGAIASKGDDIIGLELGGVFGPVHFAGEAQKVWVDAYRPGDTVGGKRAFSNDPTVTALFYDEDPSFRSAYAELGFFLTGESRAYKGGKWDRVKVLKPFDQGGFGAVQVNARIDYLDLKDSTGGGSLAAPDYVNGGEQMAYNVSVIWNPIDYIRFMAQYSHQDVDGGPRAAAVKPGSNDPVNERSYGVDSLALRAQVEF
jgi:phosphate-selective porin OprO/OprP